MLAALSLRRCARRFCFFSSALRALHWSSGGAVRAVVATGDDELATSFPECDGWEFGFAVPISLAIFDPSFGYFNLGRHFPNVRFVLLALDGVHVIRCALGDKQVPDRPEADVAKWELHPTFEHQLSYNAMAIRVFALVDTSLRNTFSRQKRSGF